jgi:CHAT domain-containing protein
MSIEGLADLPLDNEAAQELATSYAAAKVRMLLGDQATQANLAQAVGQTRVLQLLVHGLQNPSSAYPIELQLTPSPSDDGRLSAGNMLDWQAPELVLLTACSSGQAPRRQGDAGSADLRGALFAAVSACVLHAQSDLIYREALAFSKRFHQHLRKSGVSPAEALRQVRQEHYEKDPATAPFRLGLLQMAGLGHASLFDPVPVSQSQGAPLPYRTSQGAR